MPDSPTTADSNSGIKEPPTRLGGILRQLGPGLILAGSIVGSGELIATTRTGAEAGFSFLWLIILGCVIKVFTQIEVSRHCIISGTTTLSALYHLPRVGKPIGWFWMITFLVGLGQLGGIVGGVGQALAIAGPFLGPNSPKIWAAIVAGITIFMLIRGGFTFIEIFCTVLVATFTLVTVGNVLLLQTKPDWAITAADLREGLSFGFPDHIIAEDGTVKNPFITALAAFGIIGVGASEIVAYPYWCLEKGYGKWIGKNDQSEGWLSRAKGWIRVLQWDAWGSMVVYTVSTVAFYLLGAAVLHRARLIPEKSEMVATLAEMYEPAFGPVGRIILLVGAVAVLFSTFFVSSAQKCRLMTDTLHVFNMRRMKSDADRKRWIKIFSVVFPLLSLTIYLLFPRPALLVLFSGLMQSLLLPLLGIAALYFRFKKIDPKLRPTRIWDAFLILSVIAFLAIGIYLMIDKGGALLNKITGG
ncbi:MAG: Nramp family divalent metal transporter [Verrucomicrobiales bacterium]|nr:Nramp family divalent metal transporter [Verrucomicrobiales bacterium]